MRTIDAIIYRLPFNSNILSDKPLDFDSLLLKLKDNIDTKSWYQFGMAIGVPKDILEQLKHYPEVERMIELADYWLRNHPTKPSWSDIRDAIKSIKPANEDREIYSVPGTNMY